MEMPEWGGLFVSGLSGKLARQDVDGMKVHTE